MDSETSRLKEQIGLIGRMDRIDGKIRFCLYDEVKSSKFTKLLYYNIFDGKSVEDKICVEIYNLMRNVQPHGILYG